MCQVDGLSPSFEVLMPAECCGHCLWGQEGGNTRLKGEERNFITVSDVQCAELLHRSAQE